MPGRPLRHLRHPRQGHHVELGSGDGGLSGQQSHSVLLRNVPGAARPFDLETARRGAGQLQMQPVSRESVFALMIV